MPESDLDLITIGRSSVDLYGQQIGGRLEDVASFAKSVGGSPTNIAIGAARLGLRAGLITGVGDEHMGRFIRERLAREGVDTAGVKVDPRRLTALVLLGVLNDRSFPHIFFRENCADMGLTEADVDEVFVQRARCVVVTGTHLSTPTVYAMCRKAVRVAKEAGRRVAFDVDYRPNLWGLAGHGAGEERYIGSDTVTAHLQTILPECDLVVGTEEELHILGGSPDTLEALRAIRGLTAATLVCKRGPMGCVVFPDSIPEHLDDGVRGPGFPVEVYNTLGAGDAFMAGFLRGWLRDEPLEMACAYANACGAIAVSRLLCSPEYPSWEELQHFLQHGSITPALRLDPVLTHLHRTTTRPVVPTPLRALAIDHRSQFEALADRLGAPRERISTFKTLAVRAAAEVASGREGYGILLDGTHGREALFRAADAGLWIARPVERPGSRPLSFEMADVGSHLVEWPVTHTVKCLCFYRADDPEALRERQEAQLLIIQDACRTVGRELLVEIICGKDGPLADDTTAAALMHLYRCGLAPDWWKLEPQPSAEAWQQVERTVNGADPHCRGILLLGLDAPEARLIEAFTLAAQSPIVKGFAIGRTIFGEAADRWLRGTADESAVIADLAARFRRLAEAWDRAAAAGSAPAQMH